MNATDGTDWTVTLSDARSHNWAPHIGAAGGGVPSPVGGVDFAVRPDASPVEVMEQAGAVAAVALPRILKGAPSASEACQAEQAVPMELIDITTWHKAGIDLVARLAYNGGHVMVSAGEMYRLSAPWEEPGLHLVHRVGSEVGPRAGDHGRLIRTELTFDIAPLDGTDS